MAWAKLVATAADEGADVLEAALYGLPPEVAERLRELGAQEGGESPAGPLVALTRYRSPAED